MSPLLLRRYRAERLLGQEFERLRDRVLRLVRTRLRVAGVKPEEIELETCYAQGWHGLYRVIMEGHQINDPVAWLVLATYRRAIDEYRVLRHRSGVRLVDEMMGSFDESADQFAEEIDARVKVRHLFEALRGRLNARECEAASLCYLQGLTRAQAAAQMGISEARMGKLMEGNSKRMGVAGKVGALLETIRVGDWCEQQTSLMLGLAFGILDPEGERYRLAQLHQRECSACRRYVLSLRGLASVLPPLPLPWGLGFGTLAGAGAGAAGGAGAGATAGGGAGAAAGSSGAVTGASVGALSASGAAGLGGAAGGGWLLAGGSVGAKLAVGCLMALGLGAGCVALSDGHHGHSRSSHSQAAAAQGLGARSGGALAGAAANPLSGLPGGSATSKGATRVGAGPTTTSTGVGGARQAAREFGPELVPPGKQPGSATGVRPTTEATAKVASVKPRATTRTTGSAAHRSTNAQREFGVG